MLRKSWFALSPQACFFHREASFHRHPLSGGPWAAACYSASSLLALPGRTPPLHHPLLSVRWNWIGYIQISVNLHSIPYIFLDLGHSYGYRYLSHIHVKKTDFEYSDLNTVRIFFVTYSTDIKYLDFDTECLSRVLTLSLRWISAIEEYSSCFHPCLRARPCAPLPHGPTSSFCD